MEAPISERILITINNIIPKYYSQRINPIRLYKIIAKFYHMYQVFGTHNALKLAKTYILGKATRFNGVELRDRQTVRKVSFLAELVKKNLATISNTNITISFAGQKLQYPLHQLIYDNNLYLNLRHLYLCQSHGCECEDRGDIYMRNRGN